MNCKVRFRDNCRLCDGANLVKILNLPASQPVDNFRPALSEFLTLPRFSMDLYQCQSCGHVQLLNVVNPKILFGNYIYQSSSSPDLNLHFKNYSDFLFNSGYLKQGDKLLDIGSNDGLFLDFNKKKGAVTFGIDPAKKVSKICIKKGHDIICDFLNQKTTNILKNKNITYNVITANNVFSHSDNLVEILGYISELIDKNGYYIFEVSYLFDTISGGVIDYIYHEHLSYHSIKSLVPFLSKKNFYIYDVIKIGTKGGSIRVICGKDQNKENKCLVEDMISAEVNSGLYNIENYKKIQSEILESKKLIHNWLCKNSKKNFIGYGASATGTALSSMLGIDDYLSAIVDDNIDRQKLLAPNSFVPIISLDKLKKKKIYAF